MDLDRWMDGAEAQKREQAGRVSGAESRVVLLEHEARVATVWKETCWGGIPCWPEIMKLNMCSWTSPDRLCHRQSLP
ncbi:Arachidonate 12-Lipoxygenase, 12R-Type [Manis pentadactyla]|nr:Arachidonate 12-Lipoxygenase, 12R-Type [Manis pentadactyla]